MKPSHPARWGTFLFVSFFLLYEFSFGLCPNKLPEFWFFGADNMERVFRDPVFSWAGKKHPLFIAVAAPLYWVGRGVFCWLAKPWSHNLALTFPGAVLGATGVALIHRLFLRRRDDAEVALLFAAWYGTTAACWVFSSFPETYVLTSLCTLVFLSLVIRAPGNWKWIARANAAAALASPQQVLLAVVPLTLLLHKEGWRSCARNLMKYALTLALLFGLPLTLSMMASKAFEHSPLAPLHYFRLYADIERTFDPVSYGTVLVNFWLFSQVGPLTAPYSYAQPFESLREFNSPIWMTAAALFLVLGFFCVRGMRFASSEERRLGKAIALYLAAATLLFVFFNPSEAFLYSPPLVPAMLLLFHAGFFHVGERWRRSLLLIVVLCVMASNCRLILMLQARM